MTSGISHGVLRVRATDSIRKFQMHYVPVAEIVNMNHLGNGINVNRDIDFRCDKMLYTRPRKIKQVPVLNEFVFSANYDQIDISMLSIDPSKLLECQPTDTCPPQSWAWSLMKKRKERSLLNAKNFSTLRCEGRWFLQG
jgi:hypothetical protein